VFSIFALLTFFLACVPLYWQFEVWNVGAIWHISLVALSCLNQYFNSVIWAGDAANVAPAFCEISIRLTMAVSIGLPAASLVINRRLLRIVSAPVVASVSKVEKRRAALVDSAICGIPMVPYILLQLVAQAPYQRFDILQGAGCRASLRDSAAASFLAYAPPLVLGCTAIVYALLSMRVALIEGDDLVKIFAPYRRLDAARYARLTGLTLATLCLSVPATAVSIKAVPVQARLAALSPTSGVGEIARAAWAADGTVHAAVELGRWLGPASALLVFVSLGLGKAATAQY
ncbi:fungal pheromone STE3G-protein-coupled receptor, partial [Mycena pura]